MSETSTEQWLRLTQSGGRVTIENGAGATPFANCHAAVVLADGRYATTDELTTAEAGADGRLLLTREGSLTQPTLRWHITLGSQERSLLLRLEVENSTERTLSIERFDLLVAPTGFGGVDTTDLEVAQTGWQSWSHSNPLVPLPKLVSQGPPPYQIPMLPPTEAQRIILAWMTILQSPGSNVLAGFVTARDQLGVASLQPTLDGHRFTLSSYAEGLALAPGKTLSSETVLLLFDAPEETLLDQYGQALAASMRATPWPTSPTGWCSWYYFYTRVTEDDILRNLEVLVQNRKRMPVECVQIDDGYQLHFGEWLVSNEKFPRGMKYLAEHISERGFKPGIWLAPFLIGEQSAVFKEHPDWVVRDENDEPVLAIYNWGQNIYGLDTTNPAALEWLRGTISTIVHDWGYQYLKIDFLFAGGLRGRRYDKTQTSVQAYRRGLEAIREAAGDIFILGLWRTVRALDWAGRCHAYRRRRGRVLAQPQ